MSRFRALLSQTGVDKAFQEAMNEKRMTREQADAAGLMMAEDAKRLGYDLVRLPDACIGALLPPGAILDAGQVEGLPYRCRVVHMPNRRQVVVQRLDSAVDLLSNPLGGPLDPAVAAAIKRLLEPGPSIFAELATRSGASVPAVPFPELPPRLRPPDIEL